MDMDRTRRGEGMEGRRWMHRYTLFVFVELFKAEKEAFSRDGSGKKEG